LVLCDHVSRGLLGCHEASRVVQHRIAKNSIDDSNETAVINTGDSLKVVDEVTEGQLNGSIDDLATVADQGSLRRPDGLIV
jgi:hypothetical protein